MQAAPLPTCGIKHHPAAAHVCQASEEEKKGEKKLDEKTADLPAAESGTVPSESDKVPPQRATRSGDNVRYAK